MKKYLNRLSLVRFSLLGAMLAAGLPALAQPNWSNTGITVPVSSLTIVSNTVISSPNTVISNLLIEGRLTINPTAPNTIVTNCMIRGDIDYSLLTYATNTLITHCTFQGLNTFFNVNPSTDIFTATNHGLTNGQEVNLFGVGSINPTGSLILPDGLSEQVDYFVTNATTNTFQLTMLLGGAVVDVTTTGSGCVAGHTIEQYAVAPGDSGTYRADHLNICVGFNAFALGDYSSISNCWVHDLLGMEDNHADCIQSAGLHHAQIVSNLLDSSCAAGQSPYDRTTDFGPDGAMAFFGFETNDVWTEDVQVIGNWLPTGGAEIIQGGHSGPTPDTNILIQANVIGGDFLNRVLSGNLTGINWTNNVWQVDGSSISYEDAISGVTPPSSPAEQFIFGNQVSPGKGNNGPNGFVELGTVFSSTVNGTILAARVYTHSSEIGVHYVSLWQSNTATLLAGPFSWNITNGVEGWQNFLLPTPVNIASNVAYIIDVSCDTNDGDFAQTTSFFDSGFTRGNLVTISGSGVVTSTKGAMPNTIGFASSSYFRDVIFSAQGNSIFSNTVPVTSFNDQQYELGTKFETDVNGKIAGAMIYAEGSESGNHIIRLWNAATTNVIAGPFIWNIPPGVPGWLTYVFPAPVSVPTNTPIVIAVSTSDDMVYPETTNYFSAAHDNGILQTYVGSGVYSTSIGKMPTTGWLNRGYFRDVIFYPNH